MSSHQVRFPASGLFRPGTVVEHKQEDQGSDMSIHPSNEIQAPGRGICLDVLSDRPFPNGFGPHYPLIRIFDGVYGGHDWYAGHCSTRVEPGEEFPFGHTVAVADQGHFWEGTAGWWIEFGEAFNGLPQRDEPGAHWYDDALRRDLVLTVVDPPLRYGNQGMRVLGMSSRLRDCGYLDRPYWHFNQPVHGAVVRFKSHHHIPMPPVTKNPRQQRDRGVVDEHTDAALQIASAWCKKHHRKEVRP